MKRVALKRKTPLRAKRRINPVSKARRGDGKAMRSNRQRAIERARGVCECGCKRSLQEPLAVHHVFPRSHVARQVRHEEWNLAAIRDDCHRAIHDQGDAIRRKRTERQAVTRLLESLSAAELAMLVSLIPDGATEEAATVRAYELMRARPQGLAA